MNKTIEELKIEALAKHLSENKNNILGDGNDSSFQVGQREYLVLTDAEADERAIEQIKESACAFNYSFLQGHSKAIAEIDEKTFKEMQGKLCESFNKAVLAMIDDVNHFCQDAIGADGRGHFMSSYDGEESQEGEFFIYRLN